MILNRNKDSEYHSQKKLKNRPASVCNMTTDTMCCFKAGYKNQSADRITPFIADFSKHVFVRDKINTTQMYYPVNKGA